MGGKASKQLNNKNNNQINNQNKISDHDRAILKLKTTRDAMSKYRKKLDSEMESLSRQALILSKRGERDRAKMVLKLKIMKSKGADEVEQKLMNVKVMIDKLDAAGSMIDMFSALEEGKKQLDILNEQVTADDMEILMEETAEAIEKQDEVQNALARSLSEYGYTGASSYSDIEVEKELSALMNEMGEEDIVNQKQKIEKKFPEIPTKPTIIAQQFPIPPIQQIIKEKKENIEEGVIF